MTNLLDLKVVDLDHFNFFLLDDLDNLDNLDNSENYSSFINSNSPLKKYRNNLAMNIKSTLDKLNKTEECVIKGEGILTTAAFASIVTLSSYLVYKWFTKPRCRKSYPISSVNRTLVETIQQIFPERWINPSKIDARVILELWQEKVRSILSLFKTVDGNNIAKVTMNIVRVGGSVALDVASMGAGADIILSWIFTIKSALELALSIMDGIFSSLLSTDQSLSFIYDFFSMKFDLSFFDCKCWSIYLISNYKNTAAYELLRNLFKKISQKVFNFIAELIGATIPNSIGLPAIFLPKIISLMKARLFNKIENRISKYFNSMPILMQELIKNPGSLTKYINDKLIMSRGKLGSLENFASYISRYLDFICLLINKLIAISIGFLQIMRTA